MKSFGVLIGVSRLGPSLDRDTNLLILFLKEKKDEKEIILQIICDEEEELLEKM